LLLETLPAFTIFLSAPRQHDLTGARARADEVVE
jgi:hypothetical protein